MLLFVRSNSLLELLFAHITPRTHSIAHDLNVEFRHIAERGPEHTAKYANRQRVQTKKIGCRGRRSYVQRIRDVPQGNDKREIGDLRWITYNLKGCAYIGWLKLDVDWED